MDKHTQNKIIRFNSNLTKGVEYIVGVFQVSYILIHAIITKWQKEDSKGIPLPKKNQRVKTVICRRACNNFYYRRQIAESCV